MTDEFLRESELAAQSSSSSRSGGVAVGHQHQHQHHDPFSFDTLGKELELLDGPLPPPPPLEVMTTNDKASLSSTVRDIELANWADDFIQHKHAAMANHIDSAEWKAFDQAFDAAQARKSLLIYINNDRILIK